jgi:hypothetical protein
MKNKSAILLLASLIMVGTLLVIQEARASIIYPCDYLETFCYQACDAFIWNYDEGCWVWEGLHYCTFTCADYGYNWQEWCTWSDPQMGMCWLGY